jgi:uncharacterized membrane protein HdeD (DUF308 family)
MLRNLAKSWWTFLLRGVVATLFGLGAFLWPGLTLLVLVTLFGAYALVDGVMALASLFGERHESWWAPLLEGIAGIGAGLIAFFWPGITAVSLIFVIAAWAIVTGIMEVIAAIRLRKEIAGEWMLILSGVLSVVFGLLLVARPGVGALSMVWIIGAYAIAFGVVLMVLAFKLKKLGRTLGGLAEGSATA